MGTLYDLRRQFVGHVPEILVHLSPYVCQRFLMAAWDRVAAGVCVLGIVLHEPLQVALLQGACQQILESHPVLLVLLIQTCQQEAGIVAFGQEILCVSHCRNCPIPNGH